MASREFGGPDAPILQITNLTRAGEGTVDAEIQNGAA